jgi:hypothetical protein
VLFVAAGAPKRNILRCAVPFKTQNSDIAALGVWLTNHNFVWSLFCSL